MPFRQPRAWSVLEIDGEIRAATLLMQQLGAGTLPACRSLPEARPVRAGWRSPCEKATKSVPRVARLAKTRVHTCKNIRSGRNSNYKRRARKNHRTRTVHNTSTAHSLLAHRDKEPAPYGNKRPFGAHASADYRTATTTTPSTLSFVALAAADTRCCWLLPLKHTPAALRSQSCGADRVQPSRTAARLSHTRDERGGSH